MNRSKNFSEVKKQLLLNLVDKYKDIIENKRSVVSYKQFTKLYCMFVYLANDIYLEIFYKLDS